MNFYNVTTKNIALVKVKGILIKLPKIGLCIVHKNLDGSKTWVISCFETGYAVLSCSAKSKSKIMLMAKIYLETITKKQVVKAKTLAKEVLKKANIQVPVNHTQYDK